MFNLVGIQYGLFAVQDTDDNVIDILPKGKVCKCLNLGLQIGGITRVSDTEFDYTDEFFFKDNSEESNDTEDDYYDYSDDEYFNEEDEYESEEDEYDSEDDEELEDEYGSDDEELEDEYGSEDDEELEEDYDDYDDAYDDGYADEDEGEEISTVNKLYSHLNEEQIKLLKRYYLWFSQRIFDEGRQKQRTLQVTNNPRKLQKQKELNAMRNQGGMWAYAGYIDMGYRGADHCTLGHALRNVHLAWDISVSDIETAFFGETYDKDIEEIINSNNCIKFGIDCISDFFEIDKEYTDRLRRAQREAIKDMDFMCQYYEDGTANEVINSFGVADEIVNLIAKIDAKGLLVKGNNYKCLVNRGLTSFYTQFRKLNMVVPKSLIQEIRDNLIGWENHKFIGWRKPDWYKLRDVLRGILGKSSYNFIDKLGDMGYGYEETLSTYFISYFQLKICGYYEYNADTFKDEGGCSKPLKNRLYEIRYALGKNFWKDVEYSVDFIKKLVDMDNELSRIKDVVNSFKTPTESFNNRDNEWYIDTDNSRVDYSLINKYDELHEGFSESFESLRDLNRSITRLCKSDYRTQRVLSDYLVEIRDIISKVVSEADDYQAFVLNLLNESVNKKNAEIEESNKEFELKRQEEEEIESKKEEVNSMSDEDVIKYCIANANQLKSNYKFKFALSVLDTVKKTGNCSPKQMYYVNQIYSELSGVQREDTRPAKVSLDDRKDIEDAIDKVLANPDLLMKENDKDRVQAILGSIKKYRTISEKQMKYAEIALRVVKED